MIARSSDAAGTGATPESAPRPTGQYFHTIVALGAIAIVALGFGRTFYFRPLFHASALRGLLVAHGLAMSLWFILFLVQSWLVVARNVAAHRKLGWLAVAVGLAAVVLGFFVAVHSAAHGRSPRGTAPLEFLVVPLGDIAVFALLAGLGIAWRKRSETHKRLMLLSSVAMLPAAIARIPFEFFRQGGPPVFFGGCDLCILACIAYDTWRRRKLHPAWAWGGFFVVLSQPLRLAIGETTVWSECARRLVEVFT